MIAARAGLWIALALSCGSSAFAWDRTGHMVVAQIAWDEMSIPAREMAARLLAAAPPDSALPQLLPDGSKPRAARQSEHFQLAACWADIVRDDDFPARRNAYHRGNWHYTNFFFDQNGPDRSPRDRPDLQPAPTNILERLRFLTPTLGDSALPASQRGIHLAWALHLVGDIHQPLHTTARVTELEPKGDRGGNQFALNHRSNLHSYWDGIVRASHMKWFFLSESAYVRQVARSIAARHPRSSLGDRASSLDFASWVQEGFQSAKTYLYPPDLERDQAPSRDYERLAVKIAEPAVALAGYRLATLLERELTAE